MRKIKYTKESLQEVCKNEISVRKVLFKLGLTSGSNKRLFSLIKQILIENRTYTGKSNKKNKPLKSDEEFFTNGKSKRTTWSVRNALFSRNIKERKCEYCKNTEWEGKPIPLEVHHKDGNKYNNELSNLEILCPNCHYFTDTYKTKNIKNADVS